MENQRLLKKSFEDGFENVVLVNDCWKSHFNPKHKELVTFQNRLIKYREFIFTFLYHPKVPPDNNASERAIRNIN